MTTELKCLEVGLGQDGNIFLKFSRDLNAQELQTLHHQIQDFLGVPLDRVHCSTCQCARTHAEMPSHPLNPETKRTRSWHHG